MADETYEIILKDSAADSSAGAAGSGAGSTAEQIKRDPTWGNIGKFVGGLVGITSVIALVFTMIRRSKVFSTFMDAFLTTLSAVFDILMIPLIPLLAPFLKWMLQLIPIAMKVSQAISKFLEDPWGAIKELFSNWGDLGAQLTTLFESLGENWGVLTGELGEIWSDGNTTFWEKVSASAIGVWNFIKDSWADIWEFIKWGWNEHVWPAIKSFWNETVVPWVKDIWGKLLDWIDSTFNIDSRQLMDDFMEGVRKVAEFLKSFVSEEEDPFGNMIEQVVSFIKYVFSQLKYEFIVGIINPLISGVNKLLDIIHILPGDPDHVSPIDPGWQGSWEDWQNAQATLKLINQYSTEYLQSLLSGTGVVSSIGKSSSIQGASKSTTQYNTIDVTVNTSGGVTDYSYIGGKIARKITDDMASRGI